MTAHERFAGAVPAFPDPSAAALDGTPDAELAVLAAVCDHALGLAGVLDLDGRLEHANPRSLAVAGCTLDEIRGRALWETPWWSHSPVEQASVRDAVARAASGAAEIETTHRGADGLVHVVVLTLTHVPGPSGHRRLLVEGRDVSDARAAEAELRAKTAELDAFFSNAQDLLCIVDGDGVFRRISRQWHTALGHPVEALVGARPADFLHPDDIAPTMDAIARLRARNPPAGFTNRYRTIDGGYRSLDWRASVAGSLVFGCARDITDRLEADERLSRLNRQLRMLSDCNQALTRATDEASLLEAICHTVVDAGGYRMAWVGYPEPAPGYAVQPMSYAGMDDGYVTEARATWNDVPTGQSPMGACIRTRQAVSVQNIATDERFSPWVVPAIRRGYAAVCGLPMIADGHILGGLSVYSERPDAFDGDEVTLLQELAADLAFGIATVRMRADRVRADALLRDSEERFRRLVSNSHDITLVMSADGRVTYGTGAVESILGYTPGTVVGGDAFALMHHDDAGAARELFAAVVRPNGDLHRFEFRARHRDGQWAWLEAVGTNLLDDPLVRGVVLNIRDISDRKQADTERQALQNQLQQAMKMEAVGRLAGGIAHDFNNLLTAISGNLELAMLDVDPVDPLASPLTQASRAAASAASLTRQLLAFSRQQVIEPRVVSLNDLVGDLQKMLGRLLGEDITQTVRLAEDLGAVRVDPGQFDQVIVNLAVNARDAMPDGGRLTIETANVELGDDYRLTHPYVAAGPFVMLSVTDTGHGMPPEVKQRIFEPFFTTKPTGRGTGLGLATTFGAVKQAGGSVEVYSEVGKGTAFKIYLPRVQGAAERFVKRRPSATLPRGTETILIVEDDATVRHVTVSFLKRLGYNVIIASNGADALRLSADVAVDLVLTDVVMPGMNGQELATRLRAAFPQLRVIFTSGYTEHTIAHHGVLPEHTDFVGKPFSIHTLATKIREVLDRPAGAAG